MRNSGSNSHEVQMNGQLRTVMSLTFVVNFIELQFGHWRR